MVFIHQPLAILSKKTNGLYTSEYTWICAPNQQITCIHFLSIIPPHKSEYEIYEKTWNVIWFVIIKPSWCTMQKQIFDLHNRAKNKPQLRFKLITPAVTAWMKNIFSYVGSYVLQAFYITFTRISLLTFRLKAI